MASITIIFQEEDPEETVIFSKDEVETCEDVAYAYMRAMQAAGYTYVNGVVIQTEDGNEYQGEF